MSDKALIVVDMQNDFVLPTGALYVPEAETLIKPIRQLIEIWTGDVYFTQDWHPVDTPHFDKWPVHCVTGTEGAEIVTELQGRDDRLIQKGQGTGDGYSGFDNPDLFDWLTLFDTRQLVIVGVAADYCVRATAMDAKRLGFDVRVMWDLTRFVEQDTTKQNRTLR